MQAQSYEVVPKVPYIDLWQNYSKTKSVDIRNELIVEYSPLVKRIALKTIGNYQYFNYLDDIINEGIIALMDAVEKFDLRKNVKFETFATIKIKGAMIDFIRKQDCFPRRIKKMAKNIAEAESALTNKLGRNTTQAELADYMNVSQSELDKMQLEVYSLNVYSFEQVLYETSAQSNITELLSSSSNSPEQRLADMELCNVLADAIASLKENEQMVVALHYKEQLKIKDIAQILNISDSRVSQIHSNVLKKLKKVMMDYNNQ